MENSLQTARLTLDLITTSDDEFIMSLLNTKGWIEFIGDRNVHSKEDAVAYINKILSTPDLFYWVVRNKEDRTSIGIISFLKRQYLENFDIGFAFLPQAMGCGYAYEAAKEILAMVSKGGYHPILATTLPNNEASIKLLLKLGFHFDKALPEGEKLLHVYSNADQLTR